MLKYELDINVCKFVADYVQCGFSTKEAPAGKHRRIILYDILQYYQSTFSFFF